VNGQDAGGADIVISYTPLNSGDPTSVNFLQAFAKNANNTKFTAGVLDTPGGNPVLYYNSRNISGTGTVRRTRTVPLLTNSTTPAWLVDIP
jgi:hypothetical protein